MGLLDAFDVIDLLIVIIDIGADKRTACESVFVIPFGFNLDGTDRVVRQIALFAYVEVINVTVGCPEQFVAILRSV